MNFKTVIVSIKPVSLIWATDIAEHMFKMDMNPELFIVEEVLLTELAVWMHEDNVA